MALVPTLALFAAFLIFAADRSDLPPNATRVWEGLVYVQSGTVVLLHTFGCLAVGAGVYALVTRRLWPLVALLLVCLALSVALLWAGSAMGGQLPLD